MTNFAKAAQRSPGDGVSRSEAEYRARFPRSLALWERARDVIPAGVNHDSRRITPFPLYMERAQGCRKCDVDGNEFIDLSMGHGALLLGHDHPVIIDAVRRQAQRVMLPSAPCRLEVRWAELVAQLVPCGEMVRFVVSGTEATMLAIRLARAHTGRDVIIKIHGHFHGWHDSAMVSLMPPFEVPASNGVPDTVAQSIRGVRLHDLAAMKEALAPGDVAAVILEPNGAEGGAVPIPPGYLKALRELTADAEALLIFDEIITGFRLAPGGAQQYFDVIPDLATFAKALSAGVPAGALVGRADVMGSLAFRDDPVWDRLRHVRHYGTYSAHPLAAAAGVAALEIMADGTAQDSAALAADRFRSGVNHALAEAGVPGCAYGHRSILRLILGEDLPPIRVPHEFTDAVSPLRLLEGTRQPLCNALHRALLLEGVDILHGSHGWISAAMTEEDVDEAVERFSRALGRLNEEGTL